MIVELVRTKRTRSQAIAAWRDARDCVLEAHADLHAAHPDDRDRAYMCLLGALRIELSAREAVEGMLR